MKRVVFIIALLLLMTTTAYAQGSTGNTNIYSTAYDADYLKPGDIYRYELVVNSDPNTTIKLYFTPFGVTKRILDPRCSITYSAAGTIICEIKTNYLGFDYVSFDIQAYTAADIGLAEACKPIRHKVFVENGSVQLKPVFPRCEKISLPLIRL